MKNILISLAVVSMFAAGMTSCIDDNSVYGGNDLATLTIKVPGDADMPVYNFNYGTECELTPDIQYNGAGELTYEWSVGTYDNGVKGPLEFVSNEKTLRYFFPKGGAYYAHLVVTDGSVGVAKDFEISINRTFEQGFLIISNDKSNNGNLAFIKDRTREELEAGEDAIILEKCLQRVNSGIDQASLVGAKHISWTDWSTRKTVNRLVVLTEDEALYLDPNTFVATASIKYGDIVPSFKGSAFFIDYTTPVVLDGKQKKYVSIDSSNFFGYESSTWKGQEFDAIMGHSYLSWGSMTTDNLYVTYSPLVIYCQAYDPVTWDYGWSATTKLTDSDGYPLFSNDEAIVIFFGEGIQGTYGLDYPAYVISKNNTDGKIYSTSLFDYGSYSFGFEMGDRKPVEMESESEVALPETKSLVVASDMYNRTYYYNGNRLFVMLCENGGIKLPSMSQFAIEFPANEEITYMTINTEKTLTNTGEELIIATADQSTGRGNVYFYDVRDVRTDNPNATPKAVYKNCADRINYICYKPRIAN